MSLGGAETASTKMTRERATKFRDFTRSSLLLFGDSTSTSPVITGYSKSKPSGPRDS